MQHPSAKRQEFEEKLKTLNPEQLEAVRTTEGPVMVIAGPGTGKTTMLAYRIGYILLSSDTHPENILCLTYTDAAASEMRNRLIEYIGPEAYKIQVSTFHGFCNLVIQENPSAFSQARELEAIPEIDKFRLFQQMIIRFPDDHPLKRLKGQKYFDWKRLSDLFDVMKSENWSPDYMYQKIDAYIENKRNDEEFIYKRKTGNYQKGDLKEKDFQEKVLDRMATLRAAVGEFDTYNRMLAENGQYDFQDMLQWVHKAFAADPGLLADYQERFQYVLVDEFQDTNGIQMAILRQLIEHEWLDRPNVFVVGDDDQAIYRFQGANVENLLSFQAKYDPVVIALSANYRSSQVIIDTARIVTEPIQLNLMQEVFGQSKQLVADGENKDHAHPVHVVQYPTVSYENAAIFRQIQDWHKERSGDTMAVLYSKHALGLELAQALKGAGIPYTARLRQNVLELPMIRQVLDILSVLHSLGRGFPLDDGVLFRLLHLEYLNLPVADLQRAIIGHTAIPPKDRTNLFVFLSDRDRLQGLGISDPDAIVGAIGLFEAGTREALSKTVQSTVEWIVNRFGMLDWILRQPEKVEPLAALKTFYTFIEEQAAGRDSFGVPDLLELCRLMGEYKISLRASPLSGEKETGVVLSTLHGVKGLEYDRVLIKHLTENEWEKKRPPANMFSMPDNLVAHTRMLPGKEADYREEDLRRLLYVGMTRARKELSLSYAEKNDQDKGLVRSKYLAELIDQRTDLAFQKVVSDPGVYVEYEVAFFRGRQKADLHIDEAEIAQRIREHVLNPSGLNSYLECTLGFYYEKVLMVPSVTAPHMIFGNALHYALQQYFNKRFGDGDTMTSREFMADMYERYLYRFKYQFSDTDFQDLVTYGRSVLADFFDANSGEWTDATRYVTEYKVQNIHIDGVPVKGFIDRIDRLGDRMQVIDYKSGRQGDIAKKLARPSDEHPNGGPYWRQIVFYDLMLHADPHVKRYFDVGIIQGIEPDKYGKFLRKELEVTEADRDHMRHLIRDTFDKIQAGRFEETLCGECAWCQMHGITPPLPKDSDDS